MNHKNGKLVNCLNCGKEKYKIISQLKIHPKTFCSHKCYSEFSVKEKNINWKGGKHKDKRGYISIASKEHPRTMNGYVYEHILKMEKYLGRFLKEPEQIHHINGNKSDNRLNNLKLCADGLEHHRYEKGWWKEENKWFKKCTKCKKVLEVNQDNFYRRTNGQWLPFCKRCNWPIKKSFFKK